MTDQVDAILSGMIGDVDDYSGDHIESLRTLLRRCREAGTDEALRSTPSGSMIGHATTSSASSSMPRHPTRRKRLYGNTPSSATEALSISRRTHHGGPPCKQPRLLETDRDKTTNACQARQGQLENPSQSTFSAPSERPSAAKSVGTEDPACVTLGQTGEAIRQDDPSTSKALPGVDERIPGSSREKPMDSSTSGHDGSRKVRMGVEELVSLLKQFQQAAEPETFVDAHPELLGQETDDLLVELGHKHPGHASTTEQLRRLFQICPASRQITIPADDCEIEARMGHEKAFLEAAGWQEIHDVLVHYPDLLTDAAEFRLTLLSGLVEDPEKAALGGRLQLLRRCREIGINKAIAEAREASAGAEAREELNHLLRVIQTPVPPSGLGERLRTMRRALELVDRRDAPALWATLNVGLGQLVLNDHERPIEAAEEAIAACSRALEVWGPESEPVEWAEAMTTLGVVFLRRVADHRAQNLERAVETLQRVVDTIDRNAHSGPWAQAMNYLGVASRTASGETGPRTSSAPCLLS